MEKALGLLAKRWGGGTDMTNPPRHEIQFEKRGWWFQKPTCTVAILFFSEYELR